VRQFDTDRTAHATSPFFSRCLQPTTGKRKSGSLDWPQEFEKNCHTLLRHIEDLFVSVLENAHGHPDAQQIRGITFDVGVASIPGSSQLESLFEDRLGAKFFWEPNTSEFVWSRITPMCTKGLARIGIAMLCQAHGQTH
jgi:hypothetical protein